MLGSIRSAGLGLLCAAALAGPADAGNRASCPDGFTAILANNGQAVCRRSESVASSDLAEAVSQLWWNSAHCEGAETDRQTGISQAPSGNWTVTMRFWCNGF
jgi:hypothetical protein